MKTLSSLATLSLALFLTSCSFMQQAADAPTDAPKANQTETKGTNKADIPTPTAEQQKAAEQLLEETPHAPTAADNEGLPPMLVSPAPETPPAPAVSTNSVPLPGGGLRMGSIVPQEDPASVGDAPAPTANSAERFGLRSPKMPSKLPMGIDGKIKNAQ